jgi:hypothetical protein
VYYLIRQKEVFMAVRQDVIDRSRLGRLLVNRGLINEQQLSDALALQGSGQRLGEILLASGTITDWELSRVLKHQQRYRYAAAFVAMALTPLQPAIAFAAGAAGAVPAPKMANSLEMRGGMTALDDDEMAAVDARGIQEDFQQLAGFMNGQGSFDSLSGAQGGQKSEKGKSAADAVEVLATLGKVFFPLSNVLDAEVEMEGVYFDPSRIKPLLTEDGRGFNINLPTRIERLSFIDIRPAGTHGATMGSMHFEGIRFSDAATLVIRPF